MISLNTLSSECNRKIKIKLGHMPYTNKFKYYTINEQVRDFA